MKKEWTVEQIREFVKKEHQSVAARMTKCLLAYYDEAASNISSKQVVIGSFPCRHCGKEFTDESGLEAHVQFYH